MTHRADDQARTRAQHDGEASATLAPQTARTDEAPPAADGVEPDEREHRERGFQGAWWQYPPILGAAVSGVLLALGFALERAGVIGQPVAIAFYVLSMPGAGYWWFREGLEELIAEREVGIEFLMATATVGAAWLGAWEEAAFLVFLYGGAEAIESFTFVRTRSAIRALLELAPKEARVLRDGAEHVVAATEPLPGDVFLVRPGEGIATDGVVRAGRSSINEAPVIRESIPVDKAEGDACLRRHAERPGGAGD